MIEKETINAAFSVVDAAFIAMDAALRDSATIPLYYNPLGCDTGLSVTTADLERLFPLMAEAAHLFRFYDGPAPEGWADTWKGTASKCAAVCREASMQYLTLCAVKGQPIAGDIRRRLDSWNYMANLFATWPDRSGCTREPSTIAEAAQIRRVEAGTGAEEGKPLYHLHTAHKRQELARIFASLADAGYIDGSTPEALADFLNAFEPAAEKQGRITWIWADKRQGRPVPRHILDFVTQMAGSLDWITPEFCQATGPAIFGRPFGRDIVSEFVTRWNARNYCDTHAGISAIISGR